MKRYLIELPPFDEVNLINQRRSGRQMISTCTVLQGVYLYDINPTVLGFGFVLGIYGALIILVLRYPARHG